MKDMLSIIETGLLEHETIAAECENRIAAYLYPENGDTTKPFITIRPLMPPQDANYASDKNLAIQFFYQIDVQAHDRMKCKKIQRAVKEVMGGLGFRQQPGGLDDYFDETKRHVDARRYKATTNLYDTNY